jgi:hypothetical protein
MVVGLALCARTPAEAQIDVNARSAQDERASANRVRPAGLAFCLVDRLTESVRGGLETGAEFGEFPDCQVNSLLLYL